MSEVHGGSCFCLLMALSCLWHCSLWEKQDYFTVCFFWGSMEKLFWANSEQKRSRSSRIAILTSKSPVISPLLCPAFYFSPSSSLLPFSPVLCGVQTKGDILLLSQFLLREVVTSICELFHIEIAGFVTSVIQESSNLFFNIRSSCSHLILCVPFFQFLCSKLWKEVLL